jgi:hypothetical protein
MDERPQAESSERPLQGIGRFAGKLSIGTALAVAVAAIALRLLGGPGGTAEQKRVAPRIVERKAAGLPALPARASGSAGGGQVTAAGPIAREVERRHVAGELSEAQRRFEPCPGGDVRRTAWIDRQQRVVKLVHDRATGGIAEEWFDDAGRLREAVVRGGAARPSIRHVVVDERGGETTLDADDGAALDERPPALVRDDPSAAFFAGPGCAR